MLMGGGADDEFREELGETFEDEVAFVVVAGDLFGCEHCIIPQSLSIGLPGSIVAKTQTASP